jgi:hypothetical protein
MMSSRARACWRGPVLAGLLAAGGLFVVGQRHEDRFAAYERLALPGYDAFVYAAMAEEPRFFTLPPWGYRVLVPALVHALPVPAPARGFAWTTFGGLWASGLLLFLFLRRLGFGEGPSLLGLLAFVLSPPVDEALKLRFTVDPACLAAFLAWLLAAAAGAGPGVLALLMLAGTLAKEVVLLLGPGLFLVRRERLGTRRALLEAVLVMAPASVARLVLGWVWPVPPRPAAQPFLDGDGFWLAAWRVLAAAPEWIGPALVHGVTLLAVAGAFRPALRPYLRGHAWFLAVTLALPFAAGIYTGEGVASSFFADDVRRLLLYAVPLLVPLALGVLPGILRHGSAPPRVARRGLDRAAAAAALLLALSPLAVLDRYRRIDLRGPHDGPRVFAVCTESLGTAARLSRNRPVLFELDRMVFQPNRSDPADLGRMRWLLLEGWRPEARYGRGPVVTRDERASLLLPVLSPADGMVVLRLGVTEAVSLRVEVNGERVGEATVFPGGGPVRVLVPARLLFRGDNRLTLVRPDGEAAPLRLHAVAVRPASSGRTARPPLPPAEQAQGQGETGGQPAEQDGQLGDDRRESRPLQHGGAEGVVGRGEGEEANGRLERVREVGGREEDAGEHPHGEHHEVHEAGRAFQGLHPGGDEQAQGPEGQGGEQAHHGQDGQAAPHRHVEDEHAEAHQGRHLHHQHEEAVQQEREEVVRAGHGGGHQALQELALARVDDGEADAPDAAAHEVHAQEARQHEVDVP